MKLLVRHLIIALADDLLLRVGLLFFLFGKSAGAVACTSQPTLSCFYLADKDTTFPASLQKMDLPMILRDRFASTATIF
jgi:hypothetical protein